MPSSAPEHRTDRPAPVAEPRRELVVELNGLTSTLLRAGRMFAETVVVPTALLVVLIHTNGLLVALAAALGWCYGMLLVRWIAGRRLPGTMFVCVGMMSGRALVALATSSAFLYLLQPAMGSACMAVLFLGSVAAGRPVTIRLARDFVALPAEVVNRHGVRRMFTQVAILWGVSRLADAVMSLGFLQQSLNAGLLSRGLFSPVLTVATIALCTWWGVRVLRREGVRLRIGAAAA